MFNYNNITKESYYIALINKCEEEGGVIVFKPTSKGIMHYFNYSYFDMLDLLETTTTLIYSAKDIGNLKIHEYVYFNLCYAVQNIAYKAGKSNNMSFEISEYIDELNYISDLIYDYYNIDLQDLNNRL